MSDQNEGSGGEHYGFLPSLSSKLLLLTFLWVSFIIAMLAYTMMLTWEFERATELGTTVTELRAQTYRSDLMSNPSISQDDYRESVSRYERNLERLREDNGWMSMVFPRVGDSAERIQAGISEVNRQWLYVLSPMLESARISRTAFNPETVRMVTDEYTALEQEITDLRQTVLWRARMVQITLIGLAVVSLFVIMYLLLTWVIRPTDRIKEAIESITAGVFSMRLKPETSSLEFGRIAQGLNRMTASLEGLMNNLAEKVNEKTAAYEAQNRRLSQLYEITSFFGETHSVEELCDDFAERLPRLTLAEASSIWLLDEGGQKLSFAAGSGLHRDTFAAMIDEPVPYDAVRPLLGATCSADMFSGAAKNLVPRVKDTNRTLYTYIYPFAVRSGAKDLGVFVLYSNGIPRIDPDSRRQYESFGSHFGLAIDNQRLIERDRQYAVVHERNLMAQGLHDSIAQTLSFLNLQIQFLEDGLKKNDRAFVDDSLKLIKEGLQQSYDDVRELLLNFRERLHSESFREAVRIVVQRFEAQTGCRVEVPHYGRDGDLSPRQMLQVIFIIQEALSNVRKHARASSVRIEIDNSSDYTVSVIDNGQGIDLGILAERQKTHVGLNIMRERASRIGARVEIMPASPSGTCVRLTIPARERVAH
jgi:two-component system nitrate/nitrite sensor histidine kinase NarX